MSCCHCVLTKFVAFETDVNGLTTLWLATIADASSPYGSVLLHVQTEEKQCPIH
jgi:hypothetical protein